MRKQFTETTKKILKDNKNALLILGDIGVYGFREDIEKKQSRAINIGILEQSTISFAAGISKAGMIPIVHTIATFMVNRAFDQLKIDFGYQNLNGNFISVGASYDYAALGCTHHCPEDINLMSNIPNMNIIIPGNSEEFDVLFNQAYKKKSPKYFRLSSDENYITNRITFGKANILNQGNKITVIAVGPVLNFVLEECVKKKLNLLYFTTVRPFDAKIFDKLENQTDKFIIVEPYYLSSISSEILKKYKKKKIKIKNISIPIKFLNNYGNKSIHHNKLGFNKDSFSREIKLMLKEND